MKAKVGDKIRIIKMCDDLSGIEYEGREGVIEYIDSIGQLHGTWGGLAIIPCVDFFEIINEK